MQSATIDAATAGDIYKTVVVIPRAARILTYVLMAVGGVLSLSMTALLLNFCYRRRQQVALLDHGFSLSIYL